MAWSAVCSAITRIGELLTQEAIYLWGVEEQVDRLQTELKWMQSFLIDAEARKSESEGIRLWVAEIRDLAYDAEDVVEAFALRIGSKRKGGCSKVIRRSTCILKEGKMLHETRSKIEKIITRITDLARRLQTYGIKELRVGEGSSSFDPRRELRRSCPHIIKDNVVGMYDDIKKIVSVLVDEESHYQVVSICGMGGLGKTTLAKKVYHHRQVRGHFDHLAWVYISQQCQRRKVWEDMPSGLSSSKKRGSKLTDDERGCKLTDDERANKLTDDERGSKLSDEELAEQLFNFLKDKKCLVILDDIWSIEAWDSINPAFPTGETSSKILLTSRNMEVALHADRRGYLHEMECLKEEDSWDLFRSIVFPERDFPDYRVDSKREELGRGMVERCVGLPLAIIVLGGVLAKKISVLEWQMVSENVKSYLKRDKGQGIENVLALSYDDLPPYLRPCFLYLNHFPEDFKIGADLLIQLWIVEGFVFSKDDERNEAEVLEDVAERCLIELVERYMIQVEERDATLRIKTCRMHDLMRDLCLSKAKQENFLYVIDHTNSFQSTENFSPSISHIVRRIVAHEYTPLQGIRSFHLRSILFCCDLFDWNVLSEAFLNPKIFKYCQEYSKDKSSHPLFMVLFVFLLSKLLGYWTYMFNNFKLLRVLDFEEETDFAGIKLPSAVGNLIHLRFLSLRNLRFLWPKFPSSLGNLRCLQTLDLRVRENGRFSIYVPNVIWELKRLRHLYLPKECNRKTKLKLHTLTNLQMLVNFNTKNCSIADLSIMINLRKLEMFIEDLKEDLDKKGPIIKSKYIRSLSIVSIGRSDRRHVALILSSCLSTICELTLDAEMGKLPECHHFSSNIAYIDLRSCNLEEDPMPTLEKLPDLRILKLNHCSFTGKKMVCSAKCFPKLDSLSLLELKNLEEWEVDEGAMLALRHLEIYSCRKLKKLPDGLKFITTL